MEDQAHQKLIDATEFVPAQNKLGGFVYAGGTIGNSASYDVVNGTSTNSTANITSNGTITVGGNYTNYGRVVINGASSDFTENTSYAAVNNSTGTLS